MNLSHSNLSGSLAFKIPVAALVNYLCLEFFQDADGWLSANRFIPFINVYAGVAFLTILLIGASGAVAIFIATLFRIIVNLGDFTSLLQYVHFSPAANWLIYSVSVFGGIAVQYLALKGCLYLSGLSSTLQGLCRAQLLILSCVFSIVYTLSTAAMLDGLDGIALSTVSQATVGNFLGIISTLVIVKLIGFLRR